MKQHIESLINGKEWKSESIIKVHEFFGSGSEGSVDLCEASIHPFPLFRVCHIFQELLDFLVSVLLGRCYFESIYLL